MGLFRQGIGAVAKDLARQVLCTTLDSNGIPEPTPFRNQSAEADACVRLVNLKRYRDSKRHKLLFGQPMMHAIARGRSSITSTTAQTIKRPTILGRGNNELWHLDHRFGQHVSPLLKHEPIHHIDCLNPIEAYMQCDQRDQLHFEQNEDSKAILARNTIQGLAYFSEPAMPEAAMLISEEIREDVRRSLRGQKSSQSVSGVLGRGADYERGTYKHCPRQPYCVRIRIPSTQRTREP
jgi:hypothetical protein